MDSVDGRPMTAQQKIAEKYAAAAAGDKTRRPLHFSPLFWGGVILFVVAIATYIFTDSLAWIPLRKG